MQAGVASLETDTGLQEVTGEIIHGHTHNVHSHRETDQPRDTPPVAQAPISLQAGRDLSFSSRLTKLTLNKTSKEF